MLPIGLGGSFAPLDTFPPFSVSVAIISVYKSLELSVSNRIFSNAKTIYVKNMVYFVKLDLPGSISTHSMSGRPSGRNLTPPRGSPNSAKKPTDQRTQVVRKRILF